MKKILISLILILSQLNLQANAAPHPYRLGGIIPRRTDPSEALIYAGIDKINYYLSIRNSKNPQGKYYCECQLKFYMSVSPTWKHKPSQSSEIGFIFDAQSGYKNGRCTFNRSQDYGIFNLKYWADRIIEDTEERNADLENTYYPFYAPIKDWKVYGRVGSSLDYSELQALGCLEAPEENKSNDCPGLIVRGLPFIRSTITCHQKNR